MQIITGKYSLKQIFLDFWPAFSKKHPELLSKDIEENVEKMMACRDPEKMGFELFICPNHPDQIFRIPHSCKSRFCNTCGKIHTDKWLQSCHKLLPNTDYHHLTFTVPKLMRWLFFCERSLFDCLFKAASIVLLDHFKRERKVTPGITMVLHTFGRDLKQHPHVHILITAGGLTAEGKWKKINSISYKMLAARWKVEFLNILKKTIREILKKNNHHKGLRNFWKPKRLKYFFLKFYGMNWYVYLVEELLKAEDSLGYIGRYTKRPVIAEASIVDYNKEKGTVSFVYKDTRDQTETLMTCPVFVFIRKLIQHIPKKYFHQIRHYGLVANRVSKKFQPILRNLFGMVRKFMEKMNWRQRQTVYRKRDPLICTHCNCELLFRGRFCFSSAENRLIRVR